jgi:hypothetical protein
VIDAPPLLTHEEARALAAVAGQGCSWSEPGVRHGGMSRQRWPALMAIPDYGWR